MERVSGFWLGASALFSARRMCELRDDAGGWPALKACTVSDLVDLGVRPAKARTWRDYPSGETLGVALVQEDPRFPASLLKDKVGAPPVLFVEGAIEALALPGIGLVGTRNCTAKARSLSRYLAGQLAGAGWSVVSGLARGIDTAAHQGAVQCGATIAVLGHGLGRTSPTSNRGLRRQIIASGGAVISAWPDEVRAERWTFPARNRWIAGLCHRVVVVQAPAGSGALYTVEAAKELGIPVHVVPGDLGDTVNQGGLDELRDAQRACERFLEQLSENVAMDAVALRRWLFTNADLMRPGVLPIWDVASFLREVAACQANVAEPWLQALFEGGTVDDVCRQRGVSMVELLSELALLELEGKVVRLPGERYARGSKGSRQ